MIFKSIPLEGVHQTGKAMHRLAREYSFDMAPFASLSITELFDKIKNIPYVADPPGHELVQRPKFTLSRGGDCDDKAVTAAAYFINRGIPYRFVAIGQGGKNPRTGKIPLTHVFVEYNIGGKWLVFDATYSYNILGQQIERTRSVII
jgi:transglutaminase-like putative cysteine protease